MTALPIGKLPAELLGDLLNQYVMPDPRVVVGPRVGEDAAVIDLGDRYLVAKTDPITFATDEIGWYAVNVNANDIACCGAVPRWYLATLLLPEGGTTAELVANVNGQFMNAMTEGLLEPKFASKGIVEIPAGDQVLDEIMIFDRALTDTEIKAIYKANAP